MVEWNSLYFSTVTIGYSKYENKMPGYHHESMADTEQSQVDDQKQSSITLKNTLYKDDVVIKIDSNSVEYSN